MTDDTYKTYDIDKTDDTYKNGVLLRRKNGTIYFISDDALENLYRLPDELQMDGRDGGAEIQKALDNMPPVFDIKNAIHVGRRSVMGIFETVTPDEVPDGVFKPRIDGTFKPRIDGAFKPRVDGSFKPRVVASKIAEKSTEFDPRRSYRAYVGQDDSKKNPDEE